MFGKLPTNIKSRNKNLIKNKTELLQNVLSDDFYYVLYFNTEYETHLIIRRIDSDYPWGQDLNLKIYSIDQSYSEIINIGSSNENFKKIKLKTKIKLEIEENKSSQIPKIIMQTNDKDNYENLQHYNAIQSLIELNPNYEYTYFNGKQRREFIKKNMDIYTLNIYDRIISKTYKSDLFRYIWLYKNGGCYFDHKFVLKEPLDTLMNLNTSNILCWDLGNDKLQNGIMMAKPNENFLLEIINKIIRNVEKNFYGQNSLEPTGPLLLYNIAKNENILLRFERPSPNYREETIVIESTKKLFGYRYYSQYYQTRHYESYHYLWERRLIYSNNIKTINNYKIVVKPETYEEIKLSKPLACKTRTARKYFSNVYKISLWHQYSDKFDFEFDNNILIVKRIDSNSGWNIYLTIELINDETNETRNIIIGSSNNNIKKIHL